MTAQLHDIRKKLLGEMKVYCKVGDEPKLRKIVFPWKLSLEKKWKLFTSWKPCDLTNNNCFGMKVNST